MSRSLQILLLATALAAGCGSPAVRSRALYYPARAPDAPVAVYLDPRRPQPYELIDVVETHADGGDIFFRSRLERATERAKAEARVRGGDCLILISSQFEAAEVEFGFGYRYFVPRETCRWAVGRLVPEPVEPELPPPDID